MGKSAVPDEIRIKAVAGAQAIYRLSEARHFDHALAFSLRRKAAEVITAVAALGVPSLERRSSEAEELVASSLGAQELVRLARELGYVTAENAERVVAAYAVLSEWAAGLAGAGAKTDEPAFPNGPDVSGELNERQKRVIAYMASSGRASAGALARLFGEEVSGKTLRRDLWQLVDAGLLRRIGDNRWTTYVVRRQSPAEDV